MAAFYFEDFVKNGHPHLQWPPNSENFALKSPFSLTTRINLPKFVFE